MVGFAYNRIPFRPKKLGTVLSQQKKLGQLNLCVIPQRRYTYTKNNHRLKLNKKKEGVEAPQMLVIKYKITSYF